LALRVTATGKKSWSFLYHYADKLKRLTLGDARAFDFAGEDGRPRKWRAMDYDQARAAALQARTLVKQGKDPALVRVAKREAIREAAANTVRAVVAAYLEQSVTSKCRASTYDAVKRNLEVDLVTKWGRRPIASITRRDVKTLLQNIVQRGAAVHANNVLTNLRSLLRWAVAEEIIGTSPAAGIEWPTKQQSRERVLNSSEIKALWSACDADSAFRTSGRKHGSKPDTRSWPRLIVLHRPALLKPRLTTNDPQIFVWPCRLFTSVDEPHQHSALPFDVTLEARPSANRRRPEPPDSAK
jgi:hypothetical protein